MSSLQASNGASAAALPEASLGFDVYGYVRNGTKLEINPAEAKVVYYIYEQFCNGMSIPLICDMLEALCIPSPTGQKRWSYSSVRYILTNEKYCGDVLMQKTVCIDIFSHRSVRNTGQERQYRRREHHDPIVPVKQWQLAQKLIGAVGLDDLIIKDVEPIDIADLKFTPINPN